MFTMPQELEIYHKRENRGTRKNKEAYEDRECYHLESTFVRPVFYSSPIVSKLSERLINCDTQNKFNRQLKKIFFELSEKCGLKNSIEFKFNNDSKRYRSYYHGFKDSVFINRPLAESTFKHRHSEDREVASIIYTLVHELAHAKVDKLFSSDGIHRHDYFFIFCLFENIQQCTGITTEEIISFEVNSESWGKPVIHTFDKYSKLVGSITRTLPNELYFDKKFNSIQNIKEYLIDKSGENFIDRMDQHSLEYLEKHGHSIILHYHNSYNKSPFSDYIFYIYKLDNFYYLYSFEQLQYHLRAFDIYIHYLNKKHQFYIKNKDKI